jgi:hypothetical protein
MYPQPYECKEDAHTWVREQVAIAVPEEGPKIHRFEAERCSTCGAIRRARDANGDLIPEIGGDDEEWHEA